MGDREPEVEKSLLPSLTHAHICLSNSSCVVLAKWLAFSELAFHINIMCTNSMILLVITMKEGDKVGWGEGLAQGTWSINGSDC